MSKYDESKIAKGLTVEMISETVPLTVRHCFVETVKRLTYREENPDNIKKGILRLSHMLEATHIASEICKRSKLLMSDAIIATTATLFHDIIKFNDIGKFDATGIFETDMFDSILDTKQYDFHAEMGAVFVYNLFNGYLDEIMLVHDEILAICSAIKKHSDKYNYKYDKTAMDMIVIESDILEKMNLSTIIKKSTKIEKIEDLLCFDLKSVYSDFERHGVVFITPVAIEMYNYRLNYFKNLINF